MLPHDVIKKQLIEFIWRTFNRKEVLYLVCNAERTFSLRTKKIRFLDLSKTIEALVYFLYICI